MANAALSGTSGARVDGEAGGGGKGAAQRVEALIVQ